MQERLFFSPALQGTEMPDPKVPAKKKGKNRLHMLDKQVNLNLPAVREQNLKDPSKKTREDYYAERSRNKRNQKRALQGMDPLPPPEKAEGIWIPTDFVTSKDALSRMNARRMIPSDSDPEDTYEAAGGGSLF